jgi:hypothetical protein
MDVVKAIVLRDDGDGIIDLIETVFTGALKFCSSMPKKNEVLRLLS